MSQFISICGKIKDKLQERLLLPNINSTYVQTIKSCSSKQWWAVEMAQWLGALATLAEDLSSNISTYIRCLTTI